MSPGTKRALAILVPAAAVTFAVLARPTARTPDRASTARRAAAAPRTPEHAAAPTDRAEPVRTRGRLEVRVLEAASGRGVAAASIDVLRDGPTASAVTGADGACAFDHLPPGACTVEASHKGVRFARQQIRILPDETQSCDFRLERSGTLRGRVVRRVDAVPVADARVALRLKSGGRVVVDADRDGAWRIDELPAGLYALSAGAPGYTPPRDALPVFVLMTSQADQTAPDLQVEEGRLLIGRVVDFDSAPVAGAVACPLVQAHPGEPGLPDPALAEAGETDANGIFRLTAVPSAPVTGLQIRGRRIAACYVAATAATAENSTIDFGTIRVGSGGSLSGRVVDAAGVPVEGARLSLSSQPPRSSDPPSPAPEGFDGRSAASDADGRFRLEHLAPAAYVLEATAEGRVPRTMNVDLRATPAGEFLVRLESGNTLGGSVTDGEAPVAGATVSAMPADGGPSDHGLTDTSGHFALTSLTPGLCRVLVSKDGFETAVLEVAAGDDVSVVLTRTRRGTVRLAVLDASTRRPLAAAQAFLRQVTPPMGSPSTAHGHSAADGLIEIPGVKGGTYDLVVHAGGRAPVTSLGVVVADEGVTELGAIALVDAAVLRGRVLAPDGRPAPHVRVLARGRTRAGQPPLPMAASQAWTAADGTFELAGMDPGDHVLEARAADGPAGGSPAHASVSVAAPSGAPIEITLAPR